MRLALAVMMLMLATAALFSTPAEDFDPGLKVGESLPPFRLPDQNGTLHDFKSLKGTKGLALLFFRSADW
jgi:cytochrome oxidase Cu insertion factor (SCO1/SenC/PrrC family)